MRFGTWVSVKDRLPKDYNDYIVCFSDGTMSIGHIDFDDNSKWYTQIGYYEPVAWWTGDLPYPYKEMTEAEKWSLMS